MATIGDLDTAVATYKESLVARFEASKAVESANAAFEKSKQAVQKANESLVEVARALNQV